MSKNKIVVGIDIGGTNTAYGFVENSGNVVVENSIPTEAKLGSENLFNRLFINLKINLKKLEDKYELIGIGIGAPNANYYKGIMENPPNLPWGDVNVIEIVKKYIDLPAVITNDANAAAIGEMKFGAAKGMKDFIMITLGTGVGSGIVVNGELVYGHDGFAGEIGHTIYDPDGRICGCGRRGCLETYTSANGIKRTVFELLGEFNDDSILRSVSFNDLNSKMIADAATQGDKLAMEAFDRTAKILAVKLADAIAHTSPEAIILFGGLALAGELIFKPLYKYLDLFTLNVFKGKVKVIPSGLSNGNIAVLGAAALIWKEFENLENL